MKRTLYLWGAMIAAVPLFTGCETDSANAADTQSAPSATVVATNPTGPQIAETQVIAPVLPSNVDPQSPLAEVIKLSNAGVGESVIVNYINNSAAPFRLDTDQIIYLRDLGLSDNAINGMLQRDQALGVNATAEAVPAPEAPAAPAAPASAPAYSAPLNPPASAAPAVQTVPGDPNYTYFYDSLAPYGSWVYVEDYGYCWQPTVVFVDRSWQPYCNSGHWVYSDCGWYWASDYSWGWAPFHYGRWFNHPRRGWCWAPDREWGPSWVTWRYNDNYCGWAPLPPGSHYRSGGGFSYRGRHVDAGFSFGISVDCFTFVSVSHFTDRRPWEHRASHGDRTRIYNNTTVINNYVVGNNNTIINNGIGRDRIERANHTTIKPVRIRDNDGPGNRGERHERFQGGELVVNRPRLDQHDAIGGRTIPHFDTPPRNLPGNPNPGNTGNRGDRPGDRNDNNGPGNRGDRNDRNTGPGNDNHGGTPVVHNPTGNNNNPSGPGNQSGNNQGRDRNDRDNNNRPNTGNNVVQPDNKPAPFATVGQPRRTPRNTPNNNANNSGNNNQGGTPQVFRPPTPVQRGPSVSAPPTPVTAPGVGTTTPGVRTTTPDVHTTAPGTPTTAPGTRTTALLDPRNL